VRSGGVGVWLTRKRGFYLSLCSVEVFASANRLNAVIKVSFDRGMYIEVIQDLPTHIPFALHLFVIN
jgi:hypothetical protein